MQTNRWAALARLPRPIYALIAGVIATFISAFGSGNASYWGDEAASVMSATRSLDSLWPMLGTVDAVHGLYYVFLHGWIDIFGPSEFSTRMPAAIAVGFAAAGLLLLVWRMAGPHLAAIATVIFAVLPRVTNIGSEARGYALAAAGVVWIVYGLIALLDAYPRRRWLWWVWAIGLALTATMFMYSLLILPVLGVWLLLNRRGPDRFWRTVIFGCIAVVFSLPVIVMGYLERDQIGFLANRPPGWDGVFITQWFGSGALAIPAWILIVIAIAGMVLRRREKQPLETLALAWMILPPILLGLISIVSPSYSQRYLSICTPAVAIMMMLGIREIVRRIRPLSESVSVLVSWVLVVGLVLASAPSYFSQRSAFGKDGSDLRQISEVIAEHAEPGDAVIFNDDIRPSRKPRLALRLYPEAFSGILDPGLTRAFDRTDFLWDEALPAAETPVPAEVDTLWYAISGSDKPERAPEDLATFEAQGFSVDELVKIKRTWVYRLVRDVG